jgi:uncharacterized protein with GYD domain
VPADVVEAFVGVRGSQDLFFALTEDCSMATYFALCNWTDQGVRNVKDTTQRAEAAEAAARKAGVTMKSVMWTLGSYDMVVQLEAPDDAAVTAFGLAVGMQGNIRTQTLRAFTRDEMKAILGKLSG